MGPLDGRTLFMFCYYWVRYFARVRGLVASNFLAFLSDFVFLDFFVFLAAIWFLFSVRAILTTTRDDIFNKLESHRGLVRYFDFGINSGLVASNFFTLLSNSVFLVFSFAIFLLFLTFATCLLAI